jgi:hypothetical protein
VAYHGCFSAAGEIEQIDDLGAVQQAEGVLAVEELDAQVVEGLVDQEEVERWCGPCDSGRSRSLQVAPWSSACCLWRRAYELGCNLCRRGSPRRASLG